MDAELQQALQLFLTESEEGLATAEQALMTLECRPQDEESVATVFRAAHTLKGNAGFFGFQGLTELAHALEDVLDRVRKRELPATAPLVTLLLRSIDALRGMVPEAVWGTDGLLPEHQALLQQLLRAGSAQASDPAGMDLAPAGAGDDGVVVEERRSGPGRRGADQHEGTVRVELDTLDRMMNLTGEISVARGRLTQLLAGVPGKVGEAVLEADAEADRLSRELQELVLKVRMVPLGPVFRRYVRTVRDVAAAHRRRARLVVEGEDVEVDTTVVQHIHDPLTHMIRNAIDHGIEPPDVRAARGKDPCGTVTLRACRDAGSIVIQVADDGAGLQREKILARARALGRLAEGQALTDHEIQRLVLEPGFSTAAQVTDLSGRGVGLDVVRRNVEHLRGSVTIDSRAGEGTTVTVRLPLTVAIIAGFVVGVGDETYVIPLDTVVECLELPGGEAPHQDGRGVMNVRGRALPYVCLRGVFGLPPAPPRRRAVVVVRHDGGQAGLAVDQLCGESQTVLKPLGPLFQGLPGIGGSAILGSGRVALILDVEALVRGIVPRRAEPADAQRL